MYRSPYKIIDRKIKFAILGCGRISPKHFEAIQQHSDNAELVAVCDTDNVVLDDVVTICTPSGLHPEQAITIANAGRHVVTEKPMATRMADATR